MRMCKGVCEYVYHVPHTQLMYDIYNRCSVCEVWYEKPLVRCTCCKSLLRSKPKRSCNRKKYIEQKH